LDRTIARAFALAPDRDSAVGLLTMLIFIYVLNGTLILLVLRRRTKIAMWVLIAVFVYGFFCFRHHPWAVPFGSDIIAVWVLQTIDQVVAYGLRFTPSARRLKSLPALAILSRAFSHLSHSSIRLQPVPVSQ